MRDTQISNVEVEYLPVADARVAMRYPCSPAQLRLWIMERIDPGNSALNIAVRWRLEGCVDSADLEQAFAGIVARHRALRTCIVEEDGEPVQLVEPTLPFRITDVDLRRLTEAEAFDEAERIAQVEARTAFDTSAVPLIRAAHLRVRENVSVLMLTVHRIVCDERSVEIMAQEMGAICAALHSGQGADQAQLPIDYDDTSAWQAQWLSNDSLRRDEAYWMCKLKDLQYLELRADHARAPQQTFNGGRVARVLARELIEGLRELSCRSGCTLYMTALTALFALLHRYTGERDLAIGGQVIGRDDRELRNAVGVFANTIVLRGDVSGDPTFAELLARVRESVVADFEHLSTPLDRIVELLQPQRDLSRSPLFSINFDFQRSFNTIADCGSFKRIELPPCAAGALYDLNFLLRERPGGWRLSCEYNSDLFEPATAERLLAHYANLLQAAVANPAQTVSTMPMLDVAERRERIAAANQTDAAYPQDWGVAQLFAIQAQRTPDAVALVCGERSLRYRELELASNRLAHELQARGIGRGQRVGILLSRSPELVVALLAVLKSGAAYVPLDPAYPRARLAQIVEDAQPAALLTQQRLRERLTTGSMTTILLDAAAAISQASDAPLTTFAAPDDVAYVIFTSGSTGRPKGVQISQRALTNFLWAMRERPGLSAADTLVAVTTVSFDIAALELLLPLIVGARLIVAQEREVVDGLALLELLRRHQATVMQATPVTWELLLAADWQGQPPLKMLCGGEALPRSLADRLLRQGGELWNLYGPTETTVWSSVLRVTAGSGPVPIGPPIANTQFYVLDAHDQLLPVGVPGELLIGGDGVALGYLNLPQMTAGRFVIDPFRPRPGARLYRTGDRVRSAADGSIEFLGRADHQIKLRGFRIELGEIESVLRAQPQVADCVVIVAADAAGEAAIHAYVVVGERPPAKLIEALRSSLREALPPYMCPSAIMSLAALPRTPNGKLDRAALPPPPAMPVDVGETPALAAADSATAPMLRLQRIWSAVLGISDPDEHANFFELGGHSLLAVRLLVRIEAEFGQTLTLATLFNHPTIAEQARLLAQARGAGEARAFDFRQVLKLQPNGTRPPLIAINNTGIYYALSKRLGLDQPFTSLQLFDPSLPQADLPHTLEEIAAGYAQLIRRVQPNGPYALLGWCVAGTLAFETARQLRSAGQSVSQLVLFDTLAPGHLQRLPWFKALLADYAYRWKLIAADWRRAQSAPKPLRTFLANRERIKKLMRAFERAPAATDVVALTHTSGRPLNPEQYDQWLLQYLEDAAASYQPKFYPGALTLFRSSEEPAGLFLDPQLGWGDFVEKGIEVVVVDGDHFNIFQEPRVSQLAERIGSTTEAEPLRVVA